MNQMPPFPPPSHGPHEAPDTTRPLPGAPAAAPSSSPFGAPAAASTAAPKRGRGRLGLAAAVVGTSLLVGGAAGLGGAAAWHAMDDEPADSPAATAGPRSSQVASSPDSEAPTGRVEAVASSVLPSVVKLDVSGVQGSGSGSGIILSSDGQILTNNHVVEVAGEGGEITVSFNDGSKATARILGTDPLTDTAVIQAEDVSGLTAASIGDSEGLDVGQEVVAIGSPFGLESTVTSGIVSALNRPVDVGADAEGNRTTYPAIQTDAAINPGNSGGPLVDMDGNVIGINSSIRSASTGSEAGSIGLGFAIPIDAVLPIVEQMAAGETPTHAKLGVSVQDVADATGVEVTEGAQVGTISDDSPAGSAGLRPGDVITKVDDANITGADSLVATIRTYRPGDEVTLTYVRDGESETTKVTLDSDAEKSSS
ncbi:S1C family serine protease [Nocardioides sp. cx-173]|uniref:S1C family serine protease n=1 Tax=Nocardioides sp. cx-173 TaxID=2898796 RepID=UPI001E412969|nr:trypsin-like peptidase domain-containing protein [Nocardioides sp. cx-173]MCD4525702.1 trypsin-like peptidase domain-containing protein [Nocardioides sp. cx-173]UGB42840.1 trypsin-like peptidase domain-containing protein [Nocardioides sp. cx-173]